MITSPDKTRRQSPDLRKKRSFQFMAENRKITGKSGC